MIVTGRTRAARRLAVLSAMLIVAMLAAVGKLPLSSPASAQGNTYVTEAAQKAEACDKGDIEACYRRGQLASGSYPGIPANPEEQQRYFARACSADHAKACNDEAGYWQRGQKNLPRSRQLYGKACDLGHANACGLYGKTLAWGLGGPVDYTQAKVAFDKQCRLQEPGGSAKCDGDTIIAEARSRASSRAQAATPRPAQTATRTASYPAYRDTQCTANYNAILAIPQGLTDAEIKWALQYEAAVREGATCPAGFPGRRQSAQRGNSPRTSQEMYRPTTGNSSSRSSSGNRGGGDANARSGYSYCTKSNGASGQQYWYYGFDNKRKYGPCL